MRDTLDVVCVLCVEHENLFVCVFVADARLRVIPIVSFLLKVGVCSV